MQTLSEVGTSEQRLPSAPSVAFPALRSCSRDEPVDSAGLHSSTTVRPSTKHSGTLLPWLSGTQSNSRESLHADEQPSAHRVMAMAKGRQRGMMSLEVLTEKSQAKNSLTAGALLSLLQAECHAILECRHSPWHVKEVDLPQSNRCRESRCQRKFCSYP